MGFKQQTFVTLTVSLALFTFISLSSLHSTEIPRPTADNNQLSQNTDAPYVLNTQKSWKQCLRFSFKKNCVDSHDESEGVCQGEVIRDGLFALLEVLEEANITHWITYGTLLGALRDEKIIPWTIDADVALLQEQIPALDLYLYKTKALEKRGWMIFPDPKPDWRPLMRMCPHPDTSRFAKWKIPPKEKEKYFDVYPYVDVYSAYHTKRDGKDIVMLRNGPKCVFKEDVVFPLNSTLLHNRRVPCPNKAEDYVKQVYGPEWRIPPPDNIKKLHGSKRACLPSWQPPL